MTEVRQTAYFGELSRGVSRRAFQTFKLHLIRPVRLLEETFQQT